MARILLVSDSPYATTGLGRMAKYFLRMLPEHEWTVWGVLHPDFTVKRGIWYPTYNPAEFGGKYILHAPKSYSDDMYAFDALAQLMVSGEYDYILTSLDYDRVERHLGKVIRDLQFQKNVKWINYMPFDREDYQPFELEALRAPDVNVSITKFGVKQVHKNVPGLPIEQIYHPIDKAEFPSISKNKRSEMRTKMWEDVEEDSFIIGSVNRSFARKDPCRLVAALSQYQHENPNTYVYIHGNRHTYEKVDLAVVALINQASTDHFSFLPPNSSEVNNASQAFLNKLYRSLDAFVSVSTGEGFGYTTVEAMLTGTPLIVPDNTSFPELVQDFGIILPTAGYAYHYNGLTSQWPYVDIQDVKSALTTVRTNYAEYKAKAEKGAAWVRQNLSLEKIADQWRAILK